MVEAYLSYLGDHAVMTAMVFFVGRALRRGIGAESEARRIHGRYVFWWAVGAVAVGGPLGPLVAGADLPNGAIGFDLFCLLGGLLAGTLHGAIVLAVRPPQPSVAGDSDAERVAAPNRRGL
ncbi:hypothetical protein GobsT_48110 [Gemmata obscuriglobus]|uniref:Uncharacterized protein n=1 Tax=Gemmata obscuriglobus TaxID=114 RepID=A0A2Z3H283_9BACT|nr:hypothetical protein [Gemmata obscuriglobus]AWM37245.1 hypothetical protein C1280_09550 [Gemmata obscuriglobus]QEG30011.1 hypothetical protein GobsT_48110 [Gemmata obscuriglobus]VTS09332.1 unnamed protein product [Gemmata obscuriglobus UQM 2246]